MPFTLPALPYLADALGATISAETFAFHHGKHHQAYVDTTNTLLESRPDWSGISLVNIVARAKAEGDSGLFNNAAQIWNHSFFWQCLSPEAQQPKGRLLAMIEQEFGSTDALLAKLKKEAVGHFASGWAWLILKGDRLAVTSLHDADTPLVRDMVPLLTIDVWEHAYYIDYRNARPDYLDAVLAKAINWEFVARNLDGQGFSRADQSG